MRGPLHLGGDPRSSRPISRQLFQPSVAPNSDTIFFVMQMRRLVSSFLDVVVVGPTTTSGLTIGSVLTAAPAFRAVHRFHAHRDEGNVSGDSQMVDKWLTVSTPLHMAVPGGRILIERTGGRVEFARSGGVYRLKEGTSARRAPAIRGAKMLMGFKHESAEPAEAQLQVSRQSSKTN